MGAGRKIFDYLSALSEATTSDRAAGENHDADAIDYIAVHVDSVLQTEPNEVVRRMSDWLWTVGDRVAGDARRRVILALAGAGSSSPPEGFLKMLTNMTATVLDAEAVPADFARVVETMRQRLKAGTDIIDTSAREITRGFGAHLDDVLLGLQQDTGEFTWLLAALPNRWEQPRPTDLADLSRLIQLLRLRVSVGQADALLHDVAKVQNVAELARVRSEIREELIRIALPTAQRFEEPWLDVHGALLDLIERSGWEDVEVSVGWTDQELTTRREEALRLGALFDMGDLINAVENLVSNARHHGGGRTHVVIRSTRVEVRSAVKQPLFPEFWEELNRWINSSDNSREPLIVRPRTGLRSVRRAIRRNPALHFLGSLQPVLVGDVTAEGEESSHRNDAEQPGAGEMDAVFSVSWQLTQPKRVAT